MEEIPTHPALVHAPLTFAVMVLPLLTLAIGWSIWKERAGPSAWTWVTIGYVALCAMVGISMLFGERDARHVEPFLEADAIERHVAAGQVLLVASVATAAVALAGAVMVEPRYRAAAMAGTALLAVVTAATAVAVGHSGAEFVYLRGAGAAWSAGDSDRTPTGGAGGVMP